MPVRWTRDRSEFVRGGSEVRATLTMRNGFAATSNAIDVSNRIPRGVQRELEGEGYEVVRSPKASRR